MQHRAAMLLAILSAACMCADHSGQAQIRPRIGTVVETPPPLAGTLGSGNPTTATVTVAPLVTVTPLAAGSLPPVSAATTPDSGDSDCLCPGGQQLDIEGWCWRQAEPALGYWAKTEKCQK